MADYQKIILPNGLRFILVNDQNALSVTVLVLVGAGSKYETKKENGLSHFLEHMFFKGTKKRPSTLKISEALDRVGGSYNAFTSKEFTGYFAKVSAEYFDLALDWVSDIFLQSKIEEKEIIKEKGVILEELNMYLDTPISYIADLWEELLYGNQPAGWKTIGRRETIVAFQRKDFLNYLKEHYSARNTIVCLSGNFKKNQALKKAEYHFQSISRLSPKEKQAVKEKQLKPRALVHFKKTDQSHIFLGFRGCHLFSPQIYAQDVLTTILGGNMSSRLFIEIREKRGLAYYVSSLSQAYTDSGYLACRAGLRNEKAKEAVQIILKECRKLKQKPVSLAELKKAKDYLRGSLALGLESSNARASFYAGQELLTQEILTAKEKSAKINQVSRVQVQKLAEELFQPSKLNLALIGPWRKQSGFLNVLKI